MKIAIGADHAGFERKLHLIGYLQTQNIAVADLGTYTLASCDYPDYAHDVAAAVAEQTADRGILICGSGQGVAITANKHANIRAALCWNAEVARLARAHNDANVLCLPARFVTATEAVEIVAAFLQTPFEGGRHQQRIDKIGA